MKTLLSIALFALASCTPQAYIANLSNYGPAIKANPKAVKLDPADVTTVNTVKFEGGVKLKTDYATINVDQDGVVIDGTVDIDLSGNK
jgi:hypothetical protein